MASPSLVGLPARSAAITTVIEAAASRDLTTLAIVKDELMIIDGASDAFLNRAITQASAAAATYCNRVLMAEKVKDEFWPRREVWPGQVQAGIAPLQLARWPVQSIVSVTQDGDALADSTDYRLDAEAGQLWRLDGNGYPAYWLPYNITVNYIGGYAAIPDDLQDACIRLVKARWFARTRDPGLRGETTPGVYEAQYWLGSGPGASGNMPPDVAGLLDSYRIPTIG